MAIADEKIKQSIRRDTLIRMEVKADVTDHLTYVSGISYNVVLHVGAYYEPVAAYQDGVSRSISWNSSTTTLTIDLALPLTEYYPVTVVFYLYLTTEETKYLDKDNPTGSISTVAEWEPRILDNVVYQDYISDIFDGIFPFPSGSSFTVINSDKRLTGFFERKEDYICPYYFYKNEVKVWQGLNDFYEYSGNFYVESVNIDSFDKIKFIIKPQTKKLMDDATFGDTFEECYASKTDYLDIDPSLDGYPIPMIFSPNTGPNMRASEAWGTPQAYYDENSINMNRAICIDYNSVSDNAYNNNYILCRVPQALGYANSTLYITNGSTSNTVTTTGTSGSITYRKASMVTAVDIHRIVSGIRIQVYWADTSWTYEDLVYVDVTNNEIWVTNGKPSLGFTRIKRLTPIVFWSRSGESGTNILTSSNFYASFTETATENGNYLIKVDRTKTSPDYWPSNVEYFFTVFIDSYIYNAESLAYKFLDAVGLYNNYSDTSAKTNQAFFQIPRIGEKKYKTYAQYLSEIINPITMSMLRLNPHPISPYYEFVEMPSTIDSSNYPSTYHDITDTDIIEGSLSYEKSYDDIVTKLIVINKDITNKDVRVLSSKTYFNRREFNVYAQDKVREINHASLYPDLWPSDLTTVNDMIRSPKVRYRLIVSLKFFNVKILDVIKITSKQLMSGIDDGTEFIFLVVTSIEKGSSSIRIEGQQVTYL